MELFAAIHTRSSAGRLAEPGPDPAQLARILDAAGHVPDHGRLRPWTFVVLESELKERFATAAAQAKRLRLPDMTEEQFAGERRKILRSPCIVVVGCTVRRAQTKIPEIEQVMTVAAAAEHLFLAAHDLGFGVMWKTGAAAYDTGVKALVGLQPDDHIVGIMHLGTRPV